MPQVDLSNCADEPIHIPGAIQPHGLLVAFDRERHVVAFGADARAVLGESLALGAPLAKLSIASLGTSLPASIWHEDGAGTPDRHLHSIEIDDACYEVTAHAWDGRVIVELEREGMGESANLRPGRAYNAVRSAESVAMLLDRAVEALASITGYDRVMAYCFHADDSGEVAAERHVAELKPFLGQRYPASDIPAQARRLYVLNTVRAVVDVRATPVPLVVARDARPVDLSYADLRAVSPIHIEYLRNMGVGASMSLSLIVDGRLWGLLACHHRTARHLAGDVRLLCEGFAHAVSARVQALVTRDRLKRTEHAERVRVALAGDLLDVDQLLPAVAKNIDEVAATLDADAVVVAYGAGLVQSANVSLDAAQAVVELVKQRQRDGRYETEALGDWPAALATRAAPWIGVLARGFDPSMEGWVVALRGEQVATINWGGDPHKPVEIGPNGPRLTPRGSFDVWTETVRGRAAPWLEVTRGIADDLVGTLDRHLVNQRAQIEHVRAHVLAMLGHDLRNPLQAIKTAAFLIEREHPAAALAGQIRHSSSRMARLIGQSLDFTRLTNGLALSVKRQSADLAKVTADIAREFTTAFPEVVIAADLPATVEATVDADRYAQVVSNLLSNARHHGTPGHPVGLALAPAEDGVLLSVSNVAPPIPAGVAETLWSPFKRSSLGAESNTNGLGIGLYIVAEIVREHGGTIRYRHDGERVVFDVWLPGSPAS